MRLTALSLLFLSACNPGSPPEETDDTDGFSDVPIGDTSVVDVPSAPFELKLMDSSDTPLAHAEVALCALICQVKETDVDGKVAFTAEARAHSLHINTGDTNLPEVVFPLFFEADVMQTLDLRIPALETPLVLSEPSSREVATNLFLTLGAGDLEIPLDPTTITEVHGVAVEAPHFPPIYLGETTAQPEMVWYLGPYQSAQTGGTAFKITNAWGAVAGETYSVYVAHYETFEFVDLGTIAVSEDGNSISGEAKLPELTTLVIVKD